MGAADVSDSRTYLFSLEQIGIKLGLDQINALLDRLGRPDRAFTSIVVAGTNGKGSTSAMIERGLRAAGLRTGRYTSPHLVNIEERVAINGAPIPPATFDRVADRIRAASRSLPDPPTFFEATTALALEAFRDAGVDVAVLEVGLGGRLDATNAVAAAAAVITAIDFDHEAHLGHTLAAIAAEKAGVIKPGQTVVLAENPDPVVGVVRSACEERSATLVRAFADVTCLVSVRDGRTTLTLGTPGGHYPSLVLSLRGRHQVDNAVTSIRLLEAIDGRAGLRVPEHARRTAVEQVEWPARLELRATPHGDVLIDGAHNPAGARSLAAYVHDTYGRRLPFVLGVMSDKKIDDIVEALAGVASHIVATAADSSRAARPEVVARAASRVAGDVPVSIARDAATALRAAQAIGDTVVVAGSLYLAGEMRSLL